MNLAFLSTEKAVNILQSFLIISNPLTNNLDEVRKELLFRSRYVLKLQRGKIHFKWEPKEKHNINHSSK